MYRRYVLSIAAALAGLTSIPATAAFPDRPVRMVVPFAPGGATDTVARALALRLGQLWKQAVIVENKPGAGGNIGADYVAKSPPDGYTLLVASPAEVTINQFLYTKMPFDAARDLAPVSKLATAPLVLVVNTRSAAKTVQELVQMIKSRKGGLNYASSGTGGPQHLAGEQFRIMSGTTLAHVPYKGGSPATTDLLGGQVDMFFSGLPPALQHIKSGSLRALAVTTDKRTPLLPQTPTVSESGFPGFSIENWQGVFVRSGTSPEAIAQLARDIATVAKDKDFIEQLTAQGAVPETMSPENFTTFVQIEREKFSKLVKESGAKVD
jgi:tripartite-type tricarboxylate transporter receptor subunit TctC